jgi:hypothetical protein
MDYNRLTGPQKKVLRKALMRLFPNVQAFDVFLMDMDLPLASNGPPGSYEYSVHWLTGHLAATGDLNRLMQGVFDQHGTAPSIVDLNTELDFVGPGTEAQPAVQRGGGLERLVRSEKFKELHLWADRLTQLGHRVCRIRAPDGVRVRSGTGWLVGPDLVLTNYHVVEHLMGKPGPGTGCTVTFGYAEGAEGRRAGQSYTLADAWCVDHSPYSRADLAVDAGLPSDDELDFALLRLSERAAEDPVDDGTRGSIDLATAGATPGAGTFVFVLHHPEGEPIKISVGETMPSKTPLRLRYDADTLGGSSGGLVVDADLVPLALHHAGDPRSDIKAQYNQGIPLTLIRQRLLPWLEAA